MSERAPGGAPGIAVGARVRERVMRGCRPPREGKVTIPTDGRGHVFVRWDEGAALWYSPADLEVIAPSVPVSTAPADLWDHPVTMTTEWVRAPERELAPGIVQSDDTCDGLPRLADTRMPTRAARRWTGYAAYHAAYPHITPEQYERAACFEAGRRWEKARRRAKKAKGKDHAK